MCHGLSSFLLKARIFFPNLKNSAALRKCDPIMISPKCDKCLQELTDFGALAFSPPNTDGQVTKYHLCVSCFNLLKAWLANHSEKNSPADIKSS